MKNIEDWRRRIDKIDEQLVKLLNERSQCAVEIGHIKQAANLPLYQPEREKQVLANAAGYNRGPLPDTAIMRLFERILDEARSVERIAMKPDEAPKKESK